MTKNKKGLEMSFGWIFAVIVGAAIIFLAIYAAVKFVGVGRETVNTESAKQLEVLLTPIETGIEEGKVVPPISFPTESRIYNNCTLRGNFGEQRIAVATSSSIGGKWTEPGLPVVMYDKYIFSERVIQGKEVNVFQKSFFMPFKIASLVFLWTDKYCFISAPNEIKEEVKTLGLRNIDVNESIMSLTDCKKGSKTVCFYSELSGCDIIVYPDQKSVAKKGKTPVYYEGSLLYGAIFSEPEIYNCEVGRLMKRASALSAVYLAKSMRISAESGGCSSNLQGVLISYANAALQANSSLDLGRISFVSEGLESKNKQMTNCKLWED